MFRVGVLGATSAAGFATRWAAMRAGLRDLGYVEGSNLVIEYRWADGQTSRLPALAEELVRLNVDVIVTHGIPGTRAAKQATTTIPIVVATVTDPVAAGLVASFARPGGNVTGNAWFAPELTAKRLDLLKEALPRLTNVAVLVNLDNAAFSNAMLQSMESAAGSLGVQLHTFDARRPSDFDPTFAAMAQSRVEGLVVIEEAMLQSYPAEIATLAKRHRIPSIGNRDFAEAGGLIGYGANLQELFYRSAFFVDRILKGTLAGTLPVEQASKFELMLNQETARILKITLPQSMTLRADRVIT